MARHEDRQFSESDSLNPRGGQWMDPETDEQMQPQEHQEEIRSASREEKEAEAPLRQGRMEESPVFAREEETEPAPASVDREQAEEAWAREARRVESTQPGRDRREQLAREARTGDRPAPKKTNPKKKSRKKRKSKDQEERQGFVRIIAIIAVCTVLFLMVALMVVSNFVSHPLLTVPRRMVTAVITPVQNFFSGITDSVAGYLRMLKIRGNIEYEYEQLTLQLDDYANQVAQMEELRRQNESLYDLLDEQKRNRSMNPVAASVIGTDSGNYFSTLDLDVGSANGVTDYMAVVAGGGLVGVTYNVSQYTCKVRCIINSDCTVAALVQSTRDQGSVKGTLGIDGEPMCRMYYLPDNALPRPGDVVVTSGVGLEFPKGIPIGHVRESTRGMEDNKSYVVLEPVVDFQHLEFVTVYRYKPTYAEAAQARDTTSGSLALEPLATALPIPTWQVGGVSDFIFSQTAAPEAPQDGQTPAPSPTTTPAPTPSPTPDPNATPVPPNLEYNPPDLTGYTPTPTLRPTATPTPSPAPTLDPGDMTVEDDD